MLRHWSQFVPNMSADIRGHEALHHHHHPRLEAAGEDRKKTVLFQSALCNARSVSLCAFLLSQLQYMINSDTRQLFYNAHIKPHIDYASVVWDGCGEVH